MLVKVLEEHGYESALLGMSLSFYDHAIPLNVWWDTAKKEKAAKRLKLLAFKGGGHSKALESIVVWLYIQAPRCFWSEYDTYRVGMTKNSSSTMHTLDKRDTGTEDYETGTSAEAITVFNRCLSNYRNPQHPNYKDVTRLKLNLPEGWLQERQICLNYMTLQNILNQREGHRLKYWKQHYTAILTQIEHPELLYRT